MKRMLSMILVVAMLLSTSVMAFAAPSYGSEWNGYYQVAPTSFSDVPSSHWAYNAIMQVYQKKWFDGYPDGSFRPNASITRAEALKVFVVFLGLDYESMDISNLTYADTAGHWAAAYIEAGKDLFPVHTTIQGKTPFNPNMPVTREDTIYALVKALGCDVDVKYPDQSVLGMFKDQNSISGSIKPIFSIALMHELVAGFPDSTIRAQAALTRAEFATLLLRGTEHGFHDKYTAKISSVTVTPASSVELAIGESVTLNARAIYTDGTNQAYFSLSPYVASGNDVISVSGTTITGLKEGTAEIKYNDSYLKNQVLKVTVKKPTDGLALKVTGYDEVTKNATMEITGTVTDKSGSVDLTCNGKDVAVKADGSFATTVSLTVGTNNIQFVAKNAYGVEATKSISIVREAATEPTPSTPSGDENNGGSTNSGSSSSSSSSQVIVPGKDGTPYLTFDKSTGTIVRCGTSAADIVVPETIEGVNVHNIGEGAFADCKYLESIVLPSTLKRIEAGAFDNCIRLFEVEIPEGVTFLGDHVFNNCVSLTDVIIPGTVRKIPQSAFASCVRLKNVDLQEGIKVISDGAFQLCDSLTELVLPESMTEIGWSAFHSSGLQKIVIPDNVTSINDYAFSWCEGLVIHGSVNSYAIEYAKEHGIDYKTI